MASQPEAFLSSFFLKLHPYITQSDRLEFSSLWRLSTTTTRRESTSPRRCFGDIYVTRGSLVSSSLPPAGQSLWVFRFADDARSALRVVPAVQPDNVFNLSTSRQKSLSSFFCLFLCFYSYVSQRLRLLADNRTGSGQ